MSFLYPQFLWLFIPLGLFVVYLKPRTLRQATHLIILALLLSALARPQLQKGLQEERVEARDVLIALDVSYSMRAQDIAPDRYTYAKKSIEALLQKDTQDNIMLVAFTTNPLLLSPPTTDHALIYTALEALNLNHILTKGTSLKRLFEKIAQMKKVHREVVLITDGGEEERLQPLLKALQKSDVHLTILALGSEHGATIPNEEGIALKDKEGHLVISRINPLLKQLAEAVGGTYLSASGSPEASAEAIMESFDTAQKMMQTVTKQRHAAVELYWLPLLLALLLFLVLHTRASRYLLLFYAFLGVQLHASFFDLWELKSAYNHYLKEDYTRTYNILKEVEENSLQKQYALANTYYRLREYKKAIRTYKTIQSRSPQLKQRLYYNIANAYAMLRAYDKAKLYYTKALQLGNDADALHNLSLVIRLNADKRSAKGMSLPKPQGGDAAQSRSEKADDQSEKSQEEQQSSGSGSGGAQQRSAKEHGKKQKLLLDKNAKPQPLGSKVYELINKGYIRETKPW